MLALTGQRREEVAQMTWAEVDLVRRLWTLPGTRTKNGKPHVLQLSDLAVAVIRAQARFTPLVFPAGGGRPVSQFSREKRRLDALSGVLDWRLHDVRRTMVSGMARIGVAPHIADKILNHASGTISGVAAVYQRHEFMEERRDALDRWNAHVDRILNGPPEYFWRLREQPPSRHGGAGRVHSACLGRITEEAIRAQKFYGAA